MSERKKFRLAVASILAVSWLAAIAMGFCHHRRDADPAPPPSPPIRVKP